MADGGTSPERAPRFKRPSRLDLYWFELRLLPRRRLAVRLASSFFFLAGIGAEIYALSAGRWDDLTLTAGIFALLGLAGLVFEAGTDLLDLFSHPQLRVEESPELGRWTSAVVKEIDTARIDQIRDDAVIRYSDVDQFLRSLDGDWEIEEEDARNKREALFERLRGESEKRRFMLRGMWHYCNDRKKMFSNDDNVCAASDFDPARTSVRLFKGCYYLSFLTNEAVRLTFEEAGRLENPELVWDPETEFESEVFHGPKNRMKRLSESRLANHLGANTIAITCDDYMQLLVQGEAALFSERKLAPTGSGSLDWKDRAGTSSVKRMVTRGMEREFLEETTPEGEMIDPSRIVETRVLGYYRWLGRGGLPGFLGITRVKCTADEIRANVAEVQRSKAGQGKKSLETHHALSPESFLQSVGGLLERPERLSVPLFANLLALKEVLEESPEFLHGIVRDAPAPSP